jgi:hypothetical protein
MFAFVDTVCIIFRNKSKEIQRKRASVHSNIDVYQNKKIRYNKVL